MLKVLGHILAHIHNLLKSGVFDDLMHASTCLDYYLESGV